MSRLIIPFFLLLLFVSCDSSIETRCRLSQYPLEQCVMEAHVIDSVLIYPQGINVFEDKLIVLEPKRLDSIISVFSCDGFEYNYSGIRKGRANSELNSLRDDFYAKTDSSFFLLSHNIVKEYMLADDTIRFVSESGIKARDVLNHVLRIGKGRYITAGLTSGEGYEHLVYDGKEFSGFGEYPESEYKKEENFFFNSAMSAGMEGKDVVWDFYKCHDMIRCYDVQGELQKVIKIENAERATLKKGEPDVCYYRIGWNSNYIAVMYNTRLDRDAFYSSDDSDQACEIQLWTWDGELKRRLTFNVPFDIYAISEDNVLYAMNVDIPTVIYSYALGSK